MPSVIPAATDFLCASLVLAGEIAKLNFQLNLFKDNKEESESILTEIHRLQLVCQYCSDRYYEFKENNK